MIFVRIPPLYPAVLINPIPTDVFHESQLQGEGEVVATNIKKKVLRVLE